MTVGLYLLIDLRFDHQLLLIYTFKQRIIKAIVMVLPALAIKRISLMFHLIIHNHIVTPCLLRMNSLYGVIHTRCVFLVV